MGSGMKPMSLVGHRSGVRCRWFGSVMLAAVVFLLSLPGSSSSGIGVRGAVAQDVVQVQVDVVQGLRGAQGLDPSAAKHKAVVSRISGFGGWKLVQGLPLKIAAGKTDRRTVGERNLTVTVHSVTGGKARTTVVVTDPNGKPHKVTSSLGNGGTTVLTAESSGGKQVHLFVVSVNW